MERIAEKIKTSLKQEMGLFGSFSMGFADVGADVFLALGLIAAYAGGMMPFSILIAAGVYVLTGLAYAELSGAIPVSGGASVYGERAFGRLVGFIGGWGLMLDYTIDIALFAVAATGYLSFFVPSVRAIFPLATSFIIFILALINLFGIKESSRVNTALTLGTVALIVALLIIGFSTSFDLSKFLSGIQPISENPGVHNFLYSITLAMVAFIGVESISQGAEETVNPKKTLPRATLIAVAAVVIFALAISVMALGIVTPAELTAKADHSLVAVAQALPFSALLVPIVAFTGFAICFVSANTGIIGASRVTYSMSNHALLTRRFKWVHPDFRTPWTTIIIFSAVAMVLAAFGDLFFLGELYAFGALTAYLVSSLSLLKLRISEPGLERPFIVPLNVKWEGRKIPVLIILGSLGCLAMLLLVALLHEAGRNFAIIWFAVGIAHFIAYCNYRKMPIM